MDTLEIVEIGRDLLITALWLAGPAVVVSLIVGLTVAFFATVIGVWISGKLRGGAKAAASFGELRDY